MQGVPYRIGGNSHVRQWFLCLFPTDVSGSLALWSHQSLLAPMLLLWARDAFMVERRLEGKRGGRDGSKETGNR